MGRSLRWWVIGFCCALAAHATGAEQPVAVMASIKPLALIVEDVVGDLTTVDVLLPPSSSPHDYALRVSDVKRLHEADLVIWLGPSLERFLQRSLASLKDDRVLQLIDADEHSVADHVDAHGWLDPLQAADYARQIAASLSRLRPDLAPVLMRRLEQVRADYQAIDRDLNRILEPLRDRGFVVYHRGLDQLVARYGLNQVGWVTVTPEQPASARHLYELARRLEQEDAHCLFTDTAHPSASADVLASQWQLTIQTLDITGSNPAVSSYRDLTMGLGRDLARCLDPDARR